MPAIIAHRGASLEAPENTIRAFERAIGIGVDRIELDLRRTADGGIVVVHDAELSRLCGDPRRVAALSLAETRALPVLAREFGIAPNMRIPGFEEVLDRIAPRCPLYVEIKVDDDPDPLDFTRQVLDLVPEGTPHRVASFDARVVTSALEHGHAAILIASSAHDLDAIPDALRSSLHALSLQHGAIDATAHELVRELGIELWTWTVDDAPDWQRLLELDAAHAWCTNDPRGLRRWLADRTAP